MLLVAGQLAQITKEFDLDKDEKVKRATKLANDAIAAINATPKPNPKLADDQWAGIQKDLVAPGPRDSGRDCRNRQTLGRRDHGIQDGDRPCGQSRSDYHGPADSDL